jgi:hypothetical protein
VWKQCQFFKEDKTNVHNGERSECTNSSSGKFFIILHTVLTFHQVIITHFSTPRDFLQARVLRSDQETKDVMQDWLKGLAANLFDNGMLKSAPQYEEFLNVRGNYIEK